MLNIQPGQGTEHMTNQVKNEANSPTPEEWNRLTELLLSFTSAAARASSSETSALDEPKKTVGRAAAAA